MNINYHEIIVNNLNTLCYLADIDTYDLLYISKALLKRFNIDEDSYYGKKCYEILQGADAPCAFCTNKYLTPDNFYTWEFYNSICDGYFELSDKMINHQGRNLRLEFGFDITERKRCLTNLQNRLTAEETLVQCAQTLSQNENLSSSINKLLSIVGDFYKADRAYIFELNEEKQLINNTYEWCKPGVTTEMEVLQNIPASVVSLWFDKFRTHGEFFITSIYEDLSQDADDFHILEAQGIDSLIAAPLTYENRIVGFVGVDNPTDNIKDTSLLRSVSLFILNALQKQKLFGQLEELSYHDNLTSLFNRHKYMETIQSLNQSPDTSIGIVYIDINGVKTINDLFGHEYGDWFLIYSANIISQSFHNHVFRIGGDEFVVLWPHIDAGQFEETMLHFKNSIETASHISLSFGSIWFDNTLDLEKKISSADEMMYINKQDYYQEKANIIQNYRASAATELIELIKKDRFTILLQPKVHLKTEKIIGAEVLVRKLDEQGALISPDQFISFYEKQGIIGYLDLFVLEQACQVLSHWLTTSQPIPLPLSVNLSRATLLEHDLANKLAMVCQRYRIPTNRIIIELTESISNISPNVLGKILQSIRDKGFKISLDDFGSEYSSISTLSKIVFDEIKFDKSLVEHICSCSTSQSIMQHLIKMCNSFPGVQTVAEGIETEEHLQLLREYNCTIGQGYFFSAPISPKNFLQLYLKQYLPYNISFPL